MKTPCIPDPCNGRGVCTVDGDDFECECTPVWQGDTCEDGEGDKIENTVTYVEYSAKYTFKTHFRSKISKTKVNDGYCKLFNHVLWL